MRKFSSATWDDWAPFLEIGHKPSENEILWRMKGILDCLRMQRKGPIDPKYVEYLVEKTGEKAP